MIITKSIPLIPIVKAIILCLKKYEKLICAYELKIKEPIQRNQQITNIKLNKDVNKSTNSDEIECKLQPQPSTRSLSPTAMSLYDELHKAGYNNEQYNTRSSSTESLLRQNSYKSNDCCCEHNCRYWCIIC